MPTGSRKETAPGIQPRIVVGVDFTPNNRIAFECAVRLARLARAKLTLVHAMPRSHSFSGNALRRLADFVELRDEARAHGVPIAVSVQRGRAAHVIARRAEHRDARLIVLGSSGRKGWARLKNPSIAEQVLRQVSVPVLIVPSGGASSAVQLPRTVLAAVDFAPTSNAVVAEALRWSRSQRGHLTLLHVVSGLESSRPKRPRRGLVVPEVRTALLKEALRRLKRALASEHRANVNLKTNVVAGVPHTEILRFASDIGATLIIVGATDSRRLMRRLGSTTNRVVRSARVPVLVVPNAEAGR